jgi:hypothetical protein
MAPNDEVVQTPAPAVEATPEASPAPEPANDPATAPAPEPAAAPAPAGISSDTHDSLGHAKEVVEPQEFVVHESDVVRGDTRPQDKISPEEKAEAKAKAEAAAPSRITDAVDSVGNKQGEFETTANGHDTFGNRLHDTVHLDRPVEAPPLIGVRGVGAPLDAKRSLWPDEVRASKQARFDHLNDNKAELETRGLTAELAELAQLEKELA